MTTTTADRRVLEDYEAKLLSGEAFALHAESARSRFGYMPPVRRRDWAHANVVLARMAGQSDALAQIANQVVGTINLYGDDAQAEARIFEGAASAIKRGFDDVIGRSAPDAGRYSDHQREFLLAECVIAMAYLQVAARPFSTGAPGYGWALEAIADRLSIRHRLPDWE
jgi:hypothetical protein